MRSHVKLNEADSHVLRETRLARVLKISPMQKNVIGGCINTYTS